MTLDEEYIVFTSSLGEAIAMWAVVERDIRNVVALCFKDEDKNRDAVGIAFVRMQSFRAKLALADAIVLTKIAEEHIGDWISLADKANQLSDSRNNLAHFPLGIYEHAKPGRRVVLLSWIINKGKRTNPIGANDVIKIIEDFAALSNALQNLAARVDGRPEPHPKSAEQAAHHMTFQTRLRRIHAELGHPHQSSKEKRRLESEQNAAASWRTNLTKEEGDDTKAE